MKKILMTVLICILLLLCISCSDDKVTTINVEDITNSLQNNIVGKEALKAINDSLYYDTTTGVVYWWNGYYSSQWAIVPSPYYSPNGLMYKYNPETNTLEEIIYNEVHDESKDK